MRKELGISPCVILFENHTELIKTIDEYTEYHQQMVEKYRDRLGSLLRHSGAGVGASIQNGGQSLDQFADPSQQSKMRDSKKRESDEKGWMVLEGEECTIKVAGGTGPSSSSEVSVLFKTVEALNAKLVNLKTSIKLIEELPSRGIRPDQKFLVVFKDGLPKQVIPTNESYSLQAKFRYADQFELTALQRI